MFAALILSFGLSILVSPILLEFLINKVSYQHALIIFSVFNIISIPTALLYYHAVRDPTKSRDDQHHLLEKPTNTKDYGTGSPIVSDNNGGEDISNDTHLEDCGSNEPCGKSKAEAETECNNGRSIIDSHLYVLKDPVFLTILSYFLVGGTGETGFHTFPVNFAVEFHILTLTEAALGITLTGVATCIGCLFIVILSRWNYDKFAMAVVSMLLIGCSLVSVSLAQHQWSMYLAFTAFGLMDGCWISNVAPWIATHFDEPEYLTVRMSYVFFFNGLSSVIGPVAGGYFISGVGLKYVYYFYGATSLCGAVILMPCYLKIRISGK